MKTKRKSKPQRTTKVVVEKVETDWVGVHWQCRAYSKEGAWADEAHPKYVVEGEDLKKLKLLNVFEPSTLQVGDRNFYVLKGDEGVITREQWRKQQREAFQVTRSPRKTRKRSNSSEQQQQHHQDKTAINNDSKTVANKDTPQSSSLSNTLQVPTTNQAQNSESSDDWDTDVTDSQSDTASVRLNFD